MGTLEHDLFRYPLSRAVCITHLLHFLPPSLGFGKHSFQRGDSRA
jgi:hypothetical protein